MDSMRYWLQFADYFNETAMPNLIHFDSFDELFYKAMHLDLKTLSETMLIFGNLRISNAVKAWETLLERVKNDHGL